MKVQITIAGRTYTVRSDEEGLDLPALGRYVDARMSEVAQGAPPGLDDYTVAMLACLNIASDFERFRRAVGHALDNVDDELTASLLMLRSALPDGSLPAPAGSADPVAGADPDERAGSEPSTDRSAEPSPGSADTESPGDGA